MFYTGSNAAIEFGKIPDAILAYYEKNKDLTEEVSILIVHTARCNDVLRRIPKFDASTPPRSVLARLHDALEKFRGRRPPLYGQDV